jgi:hypothetical protein
MTKAYIQINGKDAITPSKFKPTKMRLAADTSGRNQAGIMNIDVIREDMRKIEVVWPPMSLREASELTDMVSDVFFEIHYPDPYSGKYETRTFYSNDPEIEAYSWNELFKKIAWTGLAMNFIER